MMLGRNRVRNFRENKKARTADTAILHLTSFVRLMCSKGKPVAADLHPGKSYVMCRNCSARIYTIFASPALVPLASLLGTWKGDGRGHYPTVSDFAFSEVRITIIIYS